MIRRRNPSDLERALAGDKNLADADLLGADLQGADLRQVDLKGAWLERGNLEGANLEGANLENAHMREANLRGANLRAANLTGADFPDADLQGANFEGAKLSSAFFGGANVKGTILVWPVVRSYGRQTGAVLKMGKPDSPSRAAEFKKKYPAEFERLKEVTQGRDFNEQLRATVRSKYETPFEWTVTEGTYASREQRLCPDPNLVYKFNIDLTDPWFTERQREALKRFAEVSRSKGHPHEMYGLQLSRSSPHTLRGRAKYNLFTVGWVRLCVDDAARTWLVEEVQSDVSAVRSKLKGGSAPAGLEQYADVARDLQPYLDRFYEDALGIVFMEAEKKGYSVEMLEYASKRHLGSPRAVYTDLPRSMGMVKQKGSNVLRTERIAETWSYKPNPRRRNPEDGPARIRLSGFSTVRKISPEVEAFLRDLYEASYPNALSSDPSSRILANAKARVEVTPMHGGVHIDELEAGSRGQGAGTEALRFLTGLADKHGISLFLQAHPFGDERMSLEALERFYRRHGFRPDDEEDNEDEATHMHRWPRQTNPRQTNPRQTNTRLQNPASRNPDRKVKTEAVKRARAGEKNLRDADLSGVNLRGADLTGADLRDADLSGVNLRGADLTGADLRDAVVQSANLTDANLEGADLQGALLGGRFQGANLSHANLTGVDLALQDLSGVNLVGANLSGANLFAAKLRRANLEGANLTGANLERAYLEGTIFSGANLSGANMVEVRYDANTRWADDPDARPLWEHLTVPDPRGSAAFRRWFGKSVTVDETGRPLVLYHGTSSGGFDTFDLAKIDPHQHGFYFTPSLSIASSYDGTKHGRVFDPAMGTSSQGAYRVFLKMEHPFVHDAKGGKWRLLRVREFPGLSRTHEVVAAVKATGKYDGVVFKNLEDTGPEGRTLEWADVYAVFDPKQIKSATANTGTFDPADPRITHNPRLQNPTRKAKPPTLAEAGTLPHYSPAARRKVTR